MKRILILLAIVATAFQMDAQTSITDTGDRLTFYEAGTQKFTILKGQIGSVDLVGTASTTVRVKRSGLWSGPDYAFSAAVANVDTASFVAYDLSVALPSLRTAAGVRDWIITSAGMQGGSGRGIVVPEVGTDTAITGYDTVVAVLHSYNLINASADVIVVQAPVPVRPGDQFYIVDSQDSSDQFTIYVDFGAKLFVGATVDDSLTSAGSTKGYIWSGDPLVGWIRKE